MKDKIVQFFKPKNELNNLVKEIEKLKKLKDDMTKQLVDAWDKEYSRNLKDEQRKKYIVDLCKSVYVPKIDVEYIGDPKDRRVKVTIPLPNQ